MQLHYFFILMSVHLLSLSQNVAFFAMCTTMCNTRTVIDSRSSAWLTCFEVNSSTT